MTEERRHQQEKYKKIIAVTMATSRQGIGVIKELYKLDKYKIRAITRNIKSKKALELASLENVEIVQGDLLDPKSLNKAFDGVYGIFGNTTPTKGWKVFRGSIVRDYEIEQGHNLINQVKVAYKKGVLGHFIFSSICKPKNPLKNYPAPGHFTSKWELEEYINQKGLLEITTILRPVSYFENFENKLPGFTISKKIFPGVINKDCKWQTIAVSDIGQWVKGVLLNAEKYKNRSINIASEELTGTEMAAKLEKLLSIENIKTKYVMIPRAALKLLEHDIGIMADWLERTGYGANMNKLKIIQKELGIKPTSLDDWLYSKLTTNKNSNKSIATNMKKSKYDLQLDKP